MNFWTAFAYFVVATVLVYVGLSINGRTENAGGHDGHGHDDHGHGGHH